MSEHIEIFSGSDFVQQYFEVYKEGRLEILSQRSPEKVSSNEDSAAVLWWPSRSLILAVADGVGGQRGGAEASSTSVKILKNEVSSAIKQSEDVRTAILNSFEKANQEILSWGIGAATTLIVAEVNQAYVRTFHVGDSSAFLITQRERLRYQSISHSPVGYAVESGILDSQEALNHEEAHVLSNVVGSPDMRMEISANFKLNTYDTLLLCSDGLTDNLETEEIIRLSSKGRPTQKKSLLYEQCQKRMSHKDNSPGKADDLTFLLFQIGTWKP